METSPRFENLLAVPSFHHDPVFAAHVRQAFEAFQPTVVALELMPGLESELAWALECWPVAVASLRKETFTPFVPGDSMFEAYRLACDASVPVHLVDLRRDGAIERAAAIVPGAECADRVGGLFLETVAALDRLTPTAQGDLDREAHMAAHLARLMREHERVLWVGGMGHWPRLRALLAKGGLPEPKTASRRKARHQRLRLAAFALEHATGRLPHLVERYALDPVGYEEQAALRALALDAVPESEGRAVVLVRPGRSSAADVGLPESASAADVSKVLVYARNLAMSRGLGDRPALIELLTAASAVIGNRYAGRLFALAMRERTSETTKKLPTLDFKCGDTEESFRIDERPVDVRPCWVPASPGQRRALRFEEAGRRVAEPFEGLPRAKKTEKRAWKCFPPDEEAYEAFVQYVLRRATLTDPTEARSTPFQSGMRDGVDVRATVRDWRNGNVFVRETHPTRLHVSNGIIDFSNDTESSPLLRGEVADCGWADPSLQHVGSVSRNYRADSLQREPCKVLRMHRELSLVTLDAPTWLKDSKARSFYDKVIEPLVYGRREQDDLYAWLDVMFEFCKRKTVAYFSRYVPSMRVHRIAAAYGVRVIHYPLRRIPAPLLERNRQYRFAWVTQRQWEEMSARVAQGRGAWGLGARA